MVDRRLVKLFAWAIGVLIALWMLAECLGGPDEADPDIQDLDRDTEQYAADCERTWQALDLAADVDHGNVDVLLDQIDTLGTEIEDPNLKALTADFAQQAQQMVAAVPPEDEDGLEEARIDFRDGAALDLATRCPLR